MEYGMGFSANDAGVWGNVISDLGAIGLGWYQAVSGQPVSTQAVYNTPQGSIQVQTGAAATQAQSNMMWIIVVLAIVLLMMWRK